MPLPNDPVAPTFATMQWVEERIKKCQMQLGPMKRGPKRWPRKGGGGGTSVVQLAVVTNEASGGTQTGDGTGTFEVCPGDDGTCVLLETNELGCLVMPRDDEGQPLANYDTYKIPLLCADHEINLKVGKLIEVFRLEGGRIPQGPYSATPQPVYGMYHKLVDYMRALTDYNEAVEQGMSHDAASSIIHWTGVEC